VIGEIGNGLVVLVGLRAMTRKSKRLPRRQDIELTHLRRRRRQDELSVKDVDGGCSSFRSYFVRRRARGLRPSWIDAAPPEVAEPLYDFFVRQAGTVVGEVATGKFQAMMQVELVNDGPVTILLDSGKLF
jgi:D-tyrosyl-tRNA(Tyr) deacylase